MKLFKKGRHAAPRRKVLKASVMRIAGGTAVALAAVVLMTSPLDAVADVDESKIKSETVYVILEDDGTYTGATVVNCFTTSGEITDYGTYSNVTNLMGTAQPSITEDTVTWSADATAGHDSFYYQGETDKALPFDIAIEYYLNGEQMTPAEIAGQTGELEIRFNIENNAATGEHDEKTDKDIYTPFALQVSMTLSDDTFTIVDIPKNASQLKAGSEITVAYSSFPLPDDQFSVTLFGQDIEMDPISITVLPKSPAGLDSYSDFVDTDEMNEGTDDMIEGTDDMLAGVNDLLDGLYEMKYAAQDMQSGLNDLSLGAGDLDTGISTLYVNAGTLSASAKEFETGFGTFTASFAELNTGLTALDASVSDMVTSVSELNDSAALLDAGVIAMGDGVDGVAASNSQLSALAAAVAAKYPDADTIALSEGLAAQQTAVDTLAASGDELALLSAGVAAGTNEFYTEFSTTFAESVQTLKASGDALYAASLELLTGAQSLSEGCASLQSGVGALTSGSEALVSGLNKAAGGVPELISAIDDMISGVEDLKEGIEALQTDGLYSMKDSLDGLDEYLQKLAGEAEAYGSFMDERNAAYSSVQFVLKTNGIVLPEDETEIVEAEQEESGGLLDKLKGVVLMDIIAKIERAVVL